MPEKRKVIVYSELETLFGNQGDARKAYRQICQIVGFGNVGSNYAAGCPALSLAGVEDEKLAQIERLLTVPQNSTVADKTQQGENA